MTAIHLLRPYDVNFTPELTFRMLSNSPTRMSWAREARMVHSPFMVDVTWENMGERVVASNRITSLAVAR